MCGEVRLVVGEPRKYYLCITYKGRSELELISAIASRPNDVMIGVIEME